VKHRIYEYCPKQRESTVRWLLSGLSLMLIAAAVSVLLMVIVYRWVNPPSTWLMVDRYFKGESTKYKPVKQDWVSINSIAPSMAQAVVAAEDNLFMVHWGFDFKSIQQARNEFQMGKRARGASTISMQVAKNVFLWHGRTITRKVLEAGFTVLIETFWSKRRIMEVYLNIAEFGPAIYGVEAASQEFFKKKSKDLTRNQAAMLTTVLPNPLRRNVISPTQYMRSYQQRVLRNMRNIGEVNLQKTI